MAPCQFPRRLPAGAGRFIIAPQHGFLNARLICHLPLIVPAGCFLRVGNDTREFRKGQAGVFDDSIDHEAWNSSNDPRVQWSD